MRNKLRAYIDAIFSQAPQSKKTVEMKEEILQNLTDKYNDLIAEGKSEEAAYNIAIASVGDISELIAELKDQYTYAREQQPAPQMTAEQRQQKAKITAIAIAMYIVSVIPPILFGGNAGPILMFLIVAAATGLLVYQNMTKAQYVKADDTITEEFKEWRQHGSEKVKVYKALSSALWMVALVVYFIVSFQTGAWHITWLTFLIAGALNNVMKAMFDLSK